MSKDTIGFCDLDNIFINLDIISQIPPNGRLSTVGNGIRLDTRETFQWLFRAIYGESGDKAINTINSVINEAINRTEDLIKLLHSKDLDSIELIMNRKTLMRMKTSLASAMNGIQILRDTTYEHDVPERSKLGNTITKTKNYIEKIDLVLNNRSGGVIVGSSDSNSTVWSF